MWACKSHLYGLIPNLPPCPWPGCENGTNQDSIQTRFSGVEPIIYNRVALPAFDGHERFFWLNPKMPWWLLATPIRNYELNRVRSPLHVASHVYHYTTVQAFKNIIEQQELWLTDYAYLNDSSEVRHGLELAKSVFDSSLSSSDDEVRGMIEGLLELPVDEQPRIFVSCFSFARDSLTQWKGYGANTLGIALGVAPSDFYAGIGVPMQTDLAPVIYDDQTKINLLKGLVHDWSTLYRNDRESGNSLWLKDYPRLPRAYFFELVSTFKHSAFADEREIRLVYREDPTFFDDAIFEKVKKHFRISENVIVPYVTTKELAVFRLVGREKSAISKIRLVDVVVGPHPRADLAAAGIREFLASHGYRDDVMVHMSRVPYR